MEMSANLPKSNSNTIQMDFSSGVLSLTGFSFMENETQFFSTVQEIMRLFKSNQWDLRVRFMIGSFDIIAATYLIRLLRSIRQSKKDGMQIEVSWQYEWGNNEMREIGEDLANLSEVPIVVEPFFKKTFGSV